MNRRAASLVLSALFALSGASCSSSDDVSAAVGPVGGAVTGAEDDHCSGRPLGVSDPAACLTAPGAAGTPAVIKDDVTRGVLGRAARVRQVRPLGGPLSLLRGVRRFGNFAPRTCRILRRRALIQGEAKRP